MEEQYAKRGAKQAREIKASEAKVTSLEASIAQIVSDFGDERRRLTGDTREAKAVASDDIAGMQRLLKLRTRELANIKRLAAEVVRQRGEVERFMIDSLEAVKRQLADERGAAAGPAPPPGSSSSATSLNGAGGRGTLPSIGAGAAATARKGGGSGKMSGARRLGSGRGASGGVDIADLAWEDRERVLRLLFSKINSAAHGSYYGGKMPSHSFDVENVGPDAPPQTETYGVTALDGLMSDALQPEFV
jgi:hypothetical protein